MSISDKLVTIANNVPIVFSEGRKLGFEEGLTYGFSDGKEVGYTQGFNAGKSEGLNEGYTEGYGEGYEAFYKWFWNQFQYNDTNVNYTHRFYRWTNNSIYNPLYAFKHSTSASDSASYTFAYLTNISDLKVDNIFSDVSILSYTCYQATSLKNARTFHVTEKTKYSYAFSGCSSLTEIKFEGVIGQNGLSFSNSPLDLPSAISVITHLKNFTETAPDKVFTCTITFSPKTWEYLDADGENSPDGTSWADYITTLGWNT